MDLQNEKELVQKARANPAYFGELYDIHFNRILNYVFRRVGDFDLANDITSEVFLKAFVNLWRYQWKNIPFGAWLYRIATNEVNYYYRRKSYKGELSNELNIDKIRSFEKEQYEIDKKEAERKLMVNEDFVKTRQILETLPIKYQEVISLRYFEQNSIRDISRILKKKEGTVKSLLSRGLEKIRLAW